MLPRRCRPCSTRGRTGTAWAFASRTIARSPRSTRPIVAPSSPSSTPRVSRSTRSLRTRSTASTCTKTCSRWRRNTGVHLAPRTSTPSIPLPDSPARTRPDPRSRQCTPQVDPTSRSGHGRGGAGPHHRGPPARRSQAPGITRAVPASLAPTVRPRHVHRTAPSVPQDASQHIQPVSPCTQGVPASGQKPICTTVGPASCSCAILHHRPIDPTLTTVKSVIRNTMTRPVRARVRSRRAVRLRSCRRATSIAPPTGSPCRSARPALHGTATSINPATTPRFPWMGLALCNRGSALTARGDALYEPRSALCARRNVLRFGEASLRTETLPSRPSRSDRTVSGHSAVTPWTLVPHGLPRT
jgi:hypothetical protein